MAEAEKRKDEKGRNKERERRSNGKRNETRIQPERKGGDSKRGKEETAREERRKVGAIASSPNPLTEPQIYVSSFCRVEN